MTDFSLIILCLLCASFLVWGLADRARMLEFPFLAAATVVMQILPQFYALKPMEYRLPPDSLYRPILMTFLALLMTAVGFHGVRSRRASPPTWSMNWTRLLIGAGVLVIMSEFFKLLLGKLPSEMLDSQWTGLPVRYMYFIHAGKYGFAVALIVFLTTRRHIALLLLLPSTYWYIVPVIEAGRRTPLATFAVTVLCALWFVRRVTVPRWVMAAGLVSFTILILNIGAFRHIMREEKNDRLGKLSQINVRESLGEASLQRSASMEMRNAVYIMEMTEQSGDYNFGAMLYNYVIMYNVPRQLVGSELKNSLMLGPTGFERQLKEQLHYSWPAGSCGTGVAEVFYMFWYFGAVYWFVVGYVMRRLWNSAMAGSVVGQVTYAVVLAMALGTYNGTSAGFIAPWFHMALFLGPLFLWARIRPSTHGDLASLPPPHDPRTATAV